MKEQLLQQSAAIDWAGLPWGLFLMLGLIAVLVLLFKTLSK